MGFLHAVPPVIAVLDDESNMRVALGRLLRLRGYEVILFESGRALLDARPARAFACVVLDLHMPEMNGFTVLETLSQRGDAPPVIVITGHDQPGNAERAKQLGAHAYLTKPVDQAPLIGAIESALGDAPESTRADSTKVQ